MAQMFCFFGPSFSDSSQREYSGFPSEMLLAMALLSLGVFLWFPFAFRKFLLSALGAAGQQRLRAINPSYPKQAVLLCDLF